MTEEELFLVDGMKWSFSRLNSFHSCKYAWYEQYMNCNKGISNFFASYGSFMHKILEMYEKEELTLFELPMYYEDHFHEEVTEDAPPNKYVDIKQSYYDKGLDYLNDISLILDDYEILGVEKEVHFKISECDCIGFIDLLLKDRKTGDIIILDHKSASLKFKKNGEISKQDADHFQEFKRQLYLYSDAVIREYGKADYLEWNMFRDQKHVKIPWKKEEYEEAIKWAEDTLIEIREEELWLPNDESFYYCNYICNQRMCCPYKH